MTRDTSPVKPTSGAPVQQVGVIEEHGYGRFAWILDGEGNRVELWEPVELSAEEFERRLRAEKVQ